MAIYFDAGTGRGKGVEIRVSDKQGNSLLQEVVPKNHINEYGNFLIPKKEATNNFGELLACYTALKIALKLEKRVIYGDSRLVLEYWSKGSYNRKNLKNQDTIRLIEKVTLLRRQFEKQGGQLLKIEGGKNPSDLGFHQ